MKRREISPNHLYDSLSYYCPKQAEWDRERQRTLRRGRLTTVPCGEDKDRGRAAPAKLEWDRGVFLGES
jgi:hypothetical protein